jgi:nucleoside-diphosphate-sugar epimerase
MRLNIKQEFHFINLRKIMTTNLTVLVVGSTGMLGFKIVSALLAKGNFAVRAMVRSISDSNTEIHQKIEAMKAKGAAIVEGNLMQPETLLPVCEGVDVVVSAVGNNDVTVPGQKNLIDAAKQQGVKRFIPLITQWTIASSTMATTTTSINAKKCLNIFSKVGWNTL